MAYSVPSDLTQHIELVHPTISFNNPFGGIPSISVPPKTSTPAVNLTSDAVPASCSSTITPACLQALYGIPTTAATVKTNTLGVSGFIDQFANQADLKVRTLSIHVMKGNIDEHFVLDFLDRPST